MFNVYALTHTEGRARKNMAIVVQCHRISEDSQTDQRRRRSARRVHQARSKRTEPRKGQSRGCSEVCYDGREQRTNTRAVLFADGCQSLCFNIALEGD